MGLFGRGHSAVCACLWLSLSLSVVSGEETLGMDRRSTSRRLLQSLPPEGAVACPLQFNRTELGLLFSVFPKPPPGLPPPPGAPPGGLSSPCNVYAQYTMSKNLRATGQFFLSTDVAGVCVRKFYDDVVVHLPADEQPLCPLSSLDKGLFSITTKRKCHFESALQLPVNMSAIAEACSGDLLFNTEQCTRCGKRVVAESNNVTFPAGDCLMATQIAYASRLPDFDRWLQFTNCAAKESSTFPPLNLSARYPGAPQGPNPFPFFSPGSNPGPGPSGAVTDKGRSSSGKGGSAPAALLVGVAVAGVVIIVAAALAVVACRKRARRRSPQEPPTYEAEAPTNVLHLPKGVPTPGEVHSVRLKLYPLPTLVAATNDFHESHRIGKGGSAEVFKGILLGGKEVAVKKMSKGAVHADASFLNELSLISSISHPNLVALEGYCKCPDGEFVLVYDYMPNGTLEDALFKPGYPYKLSWEQWSYVILDSARGLDYLHSWNNSQGNRIIHRDVKLANILLDAQFHARLTDFGIARRLTTQQTHLTTKILGTFGYLAPEYASTGWLTEKSDTYSFGVVMLAIIARQEPVGTESNSRGGLVAEAFMAAREQHLMDMVSPVYMGEYTRLQLERFLSVALLCVQADPANRPAMSEVIKMLEGRIDVPEIYIPIPHSMTLPGLKSLDLGTTSGHDTGSSSHSQPFSMSSSCTDTLCGELASSVSYDFDNRTETSSMQHILEHNNEGMEVGTPSRELQRWPSTSPLVESRRESSDMVDLR